MRIIFVLVSFWLLASSGLSATGDVGRLPAPKLNQDSWVMIEVWPDVQAITFSAYFLDFTYEKNRNLCHAAKLVFDRDQEARGRSESKRFSSYRLCMALSSAITEGYVEAADR